jgi:hypothetical protein
MTNIYKLEDHRTKPLGDADPDLLLDRTKDWWAGWHTDWNGLRVTAWVDETVMAWRWGFKDRKTGKSFIHPVTHTNFDDARKAAHAHFAGERKGKAKP